MSEIKPSPPPPFVVRKKSAPPTQQNRGASAKKLPDKLPPVAPHKPTTKPPLKAKETDLLFISKADIKKYKKKPKSHPSKSSSKKASVEGSDDNNNTWQVNKDPQWGIKKNIIKLIAKGTKPKRTKDSESRIKRKLMQDASRLKAFKAVSPNIISLKARSKITRQIPAATDSSNPGLLKNYLMDLPKKMLQRDLFHIFKPPKTASEISKAKRKIIVAAPKHPPEDPLAEEENLGNIRVVFSRQKSARPTTSPIIDKPSSKINSANARKVKSESIKKPESVKKLRKLPPPGQESSAKTKKVHHHHQQQKKKVSSSEDKIHPKAAVPVPPEILSPPPPEHWKNTFVRKIFPVIKLSEPRRKISESNPHIKVTQQSLVSIKKK